MRLASASALLAFAATLSAQSSVSSPVVLGVLPVGQNCPVTLLARHSPGSDVVRVSPEAKLHSPGYSLTFEPVEPHREQAIVRATVVLHGFRGARFLPAAGAPSGGDATDTFVLSPAFDGKHRFRSAVYTDKLTAVQWVELNDLTYGDGTQWHQSATSTCRVAPNGYTLVAGKNSP